MSWFTKPHKTLLINNWQQMFYFSQILINCQLFVICTNRFLASSGAVAITMLRRNRSTGQSSLPTFSRLLLYDKDELCLLHYLMDQEMLSDYCEHISPSRMNQTKKVSRIDCHTRSVNTQWHDDSIQNITCLAS